MTVLYVTSLFAGEGRTAFCAGLAHLLRQQGQQTILFKPVRVTQSTVAFDPDADAAFFARLPSALPPSGWPVDIAQQAAQAGLQPSIRQRMVATVREAASQANRTMIVEGPPMFSAPGEALNVTTDLAEALDANVVLMARYSTRLGSEEILATARVLGRRLRGVAINAVPRYRNHDAQTTLITPLRERGVPVLAVLPEERCLLGVTVGKLVEHLGGEFLAWEEKRDQLLDHLMIGGLVLDWGVHYFSQSETKAVIARGDRPDIHMAVLHTPTRCLVLTGGHRPIQYVEHEAKEEEVPLVLVQTDTLATTKALETLFDRVPFHHREKMECFARLLAEALDGKVLASALGN